jgi:23S rRNA (guanosine2251-2'-O)-methyltransferase
MRKIEGRAQKGGGRTKNLSGEIKFQPAKKGSSRERSQVKRHENESGRQFTPVKKDGKGWKAGSSASDFLYGILPVRCALSHRRRKLDHLYLKTDADSSERLREIRMLAEQHGVAVEEVPVKKLEEMCPEAVHQGVVMRCGALPFASLSDLPQTVEGEYPLIVVLDQIEDPHNLGAILRTCGFFKVSAVVVPQDHTSGLTAVVAKASTGVSEWFPVISVPNLARFLQQQKSKGFWVIGLAGDAAESVAELSQDRPLILVLGNEGKGMRRLSRKHCDWLVSIPGDQQVSSLNVSNAAAVVLFHLQNKHQIP